MEGVQLRIELDEPGAMYAPGSVIAGRAFVASQKEWTADYVDLTLHWRTSGRGDENSETTETVSLVQKGDGVRGHLEKRFSFRAPVMPWTYHGRLIKIDWFLGLFARATKGEESVLEIPVVIKPTGSQENRIVH